MRKLPAENCEGGTASLNYKDCLHLTRLVNEVPANEARTLCTSALALVVKRRMTLPNKRYYRVRTPSRNVCTKDAALGLGQSGDSEQPGAAHTAALRARVIDLERMAASPAMAKVLNQALEFVSEKHCVKDALAAASREELRVDAQLEALRMQVPKSCVERLEQLHGEASKIPISVSRSATRYRRRIVQMSHALPRGTGDAVDLGIKLLLQKTRLATKTKLLRATERVVSAARKATETDVTPPPPLLKDHERPIYKRRRANLPKEARTCMTAWLRKHLGNPYPNDDEKAECVPLASLL